MFVDFFRTTPLAAAFEQAGLAAVDIGARGGFDPDLLPAAWAIDAIGFEPEPEAFARLPQGPAGPWRSQRHHPVAVAGGSGERVLHIPADPQAASLLAHDTAIGERFALPQLFAEERRASVATVSLDEAARRFALPPASYLKLDVEGAELEILEGGGTVLAAVVAVKAEVAFLPMRRGQPLAADIEAFLGGHGFVLMDLIRPARWRTGPKAPHPYVAQADPGYSRGQIAHGDYLFFRAPETLADDEAGLGQALRAALVALALGYFDHALHLLARPCLARHVAGMIGADPVPALLRASRRFGRRVALAEIKARLRDLVPLARSLGRGIG